ncbi:SUMF1/EgtB/PvdO family nonheme iron enzyme [Cellulosimicrobium terreum]|nr:SUMF1/EgtB/PvdO family nonheme iron enzyme [Cellulosimicrobium terreum]
MVRVPAGRIELMDARSGSHRVVDLAAFDLGRSPVTVAEHRAVDTTAGSTGGTGSVEAPVHGVTWFEAVRWCNLASAIEGLPPAYVVQGRDVRWDVASDGFRLPTEAEWEHACRAGVHGPTYGPLPQIAWTSEEVDGPQPVARKAPNDLGLFDTLGNVWEWCWDYADTARYGEYRSLRGGGWADPPWSVRASVRRGSAPDARIEDVGFRVARGAVGTARTLAAQGWSDAADRARADVPGLLPLGWTPLRFPVAVPDDAGSGD